MVRGGASRAWPAVAAVLALLGPAACDGGGDGDPAPTTTAAEVTVPEDAQAGLGYLVLDGEPTLLQVRSCALEPVTDRPPRTDRTA